MFILLNRNEQELKDSPFANSFTFTIYKASHSMATQTNLRHENGSLSNSTFRCYVKRCYANQFFEREVQVLANSEYATHDP